MLHRPAVLSFLFTSPSDDLTILPRFYRPKVVIFSNTLVAKLAPVHWRIDRLTKPTTLQSSLPLSITSRPFLCRASYSTPSESSSNEQPKTRIARRKTLVGALNTLLVGYQAKEQDETCHKTSEEPGKQTHKKDIVATLEPEVRKYVDETPTDRWRHRDRLGAGRRAEGNGAAYDSPSQPLLENPPGGIVFLRRHLQQLRSYGPSFHQNFAKNDHLVWKNMRSQLQILTTPTADTPGTTLMLSFDNKKYLIGNLAEGTQRACVQMGARLLKVSECFVTGRTEWKNTGGLIGMILTLADSSAASQASTQEELMKKVKMKAKRLGVSDDREKVRELEEAAKKEASNTLSIFGPPNLNHTLATARRYVFRKGMPVSVHEIRDQGTAEPGELENGKEWDPFWADENIRVWAMSISPSGPQSLQVHRTPVPVTPRKRSIDEVYAAENGAAIESELTSEDRNYLTVKAVVSEMFNSSWRLDTLYETPLSQVKLPASLFIRNTGTNKIEKYTGPLPGGTDPVPDPHIKVLVRRPWPGALVDRLPPTKPAKEAVSYIIKNHMQRGKFHPERAKELKVPKGIAWSQLSKGISVTNEDGDTITSDMVLAPSRVGGGVAIVDLPTEEYIDSLIKRPEWREPKIMDGVGAIVWICGRQVAQNGALHGFMREFEHLKHVVSSPDYCPNRLSLDSAAAATVRLKQIDPERYGVPVHDADTPDGTQAFGGSADFQAMRRSHPLPQGVHIADRGHVVQLEPAIELQTKESVPALRIAETAAEVTQEVMDEAMKARQAIKAPDEDMQRWLGTLPSGARDVEIITLGTGSALPSKYRNVSATLVRVPGWGNMLLDCGENTLGQLKRVFTADEFKDVLQELRLIFISHMHADHQLGTTSVVKAWYEEVHGSRPSTESSQVIGNTDFDIDKLFEDRDRLAIVSEPAMQSWLAEYSAVEDYGYSRLAPLSISTTNIREGISSKLNWYIPATELKGLSLQDYNARLASATVPKYLLNLANIEAVQVRHCHGARAVSITLPSGFKVSYSGDCRPSRPFTTIGRGSTVCIHEATFDDELQGDAEAKNHSTTSEALEIAQAMRAKACVLTHFSQRYQKVPVLERAEGEPEAPPNEDVAVADEEAAEESANAEDGLGGPLEDAAATFPDQQTADEGQQYELPSKKAGGESVASAAAVPPAPEAVRFQLKSDMKVCVAFDYMRVKVGDIGHLEKFTPALLKLFADEEKEKPDDQVVNANERKEKKKDKKKGGKGQ